MPVCSECHTELCRRELLLSRLYGVLRGQLCCGCLAHLIGQPAEKLVPRVVMQLRGRSCWYRQWLAVIHCHLDGRKPCCPSSLGE